LIAILQKKVETVLEWAELKITAVALSFKKKNIYLFFNPEMNVICCFGGY